jgi:hypothetical protein
MTSNNKFNVAYQKKAFRRRKDLLVRLQTKFCESVPKQWIHRVAFYGLGGIRKTQIALQYVHTHKNSYERLYWVGAVSQATFFAGLGEIARRTGCVLDWLDEQELAIGN